MDNWNDWFEYQTQYSAWYFDSDGEEHHLGSVKIGQFNMAEKQSRADLDEAFDNLDERFFSLGQDDSYYVTLNELGQAVRERVLRGLNDIALDEALYQRALAERVTGMSLLRTVPKQTVTGQYARMARGGARRTRYKFEYLGPKERKGQEELKLTFSVGPKSSPPNNIHVLIGRNGVGKTHILNQMTRAIVDDDATVREVGQFSGEGGDVLDDQVFTNLVSVSFSAFDTFEPLPVRQDRSKGVQYAYVGLKRGLTAQGQKQPPKSPPFLATDFANSAWICRQGARLARWRTMLTMLEADPHFRDRAIASAASEPTSEEESKRDMRKLFGTLSSGHKIVLLTITRLVETVEERTLVLLDEPEAHLHPPLLAAFVRALSELLADRNAVAIVATHSPVVLQEVPENCVWKLRARGASPRAVRPDIETFGENVGVLTREAFGLEVTHSGFHAMLHALAADGRTYDDIVEHFSERLGGEARAIARALVVRRNKSQD